MCVARLIGWREWVSLPQLDIQRIKVKVDTGARTSALHAFAIESFDQDGQEWVRFSVHPLQDNLDHVAVATAPVKERRIVRDSGGHEENRIVIETEIHLAEDSWPIELTLTDRENMSFRMLLGRNAIVQLYYVDPSQSFLLTDAVPGNADYEEE